MIAQAAASMRLVEHPGPVHRERAWHVAVSMMQTRRITVQAGHDIFRTVHAMLDDLGATGGSFVLVAGNVAHGRIMTGGAGSGDMPMAFYGPHDLNAPLAIVAGAGGSGIDENGMRFSHCHAVFDDSAGRRVGGHLLLDETIAGADGIVLDLHPFCGGRFARRLDSETRFTVFYPEPA